LSKASSHRSKTGRDAVARSTAFSVPIRPNLKKPRFLPFIVPDSGYFYQSEFRNPSSLDGAPWENGHEKKAWTRRYDLPVAKLQRLALVESGMRADLRAEGGGAECLRGWRRRSID
jgi:hypothetical protein